MNDQTRRLISVGLIVVSAAVGLEMIAVQPIRQKLAEQTAAANGMRTQLRQASRTQGDVPKLAERKAAFERVLDRYEQIALGDTSPAAILRHLEDLAGQHDLSVTYITPSQRSLDGAGKIMAYAISLEGTYAGLIGMLGALQMESGLTTVESVQIVPARGENRVVATIYTARHIPDLDAAVAAATTDATGPASFTTPGGHP